MYLYLWRVNTHIHIHERKREIERERTHISKRTTSTCDLSCGPTQNNFQVWCNVSTKYMYILILHLQLLTNIQSLCLWSIILKVLFLCIQTSSFFLGCSICKRITICISKMHGEEEHTFFFTTLLNSRVYGLFPTTISCSVIRREKTMCKGGDRGGGV